VERKGQGQDREEEGEDAKEVMPLHCKELVSNTDTEALRDWDPPGSALAVRLNRPAHSLLEDSWVPPLGAAEGVPPPSLECPRACAGDVEYLGLRESLEFGLAAMAGRQIAEIRSSKARVAGRLSALGLLGSAPSSSSSSPTPTPSSPSCWDAVLFSLDVSHSLITLLAPNAPGGDPRAAADSKRWDQANRDVAKLTEAIDGLASAMGAALERGEGGGSVGATVPRVSIFCQTALLYATSAVLVGAECLPTNKSQLKKLKAAGKAAAEAGVPALRAALRQAPLSLAAALEGLVKALGAASSRCSREAKTENGTKCGIEVLNTAKHEALRKKVDEAMITGWTESAKALSWRMEGAVAALKAAKIK